MNPFFLLNSLSFLVVINTLMMLRVKHIPPATSGRMGDELKIGLSYVRHHSSLGALIVAWLGKFPKMGWTALLVQAVYGVLIIAFAVSRVLWLSDILLFLTGAALMVVFSTVTSLVQMIAPNEMRGRVMSIYMLAFPGGMPLGSLVSGYLASFFGAPTVIAVNGILLIFVAGYFLARNRGVRET